MRHSRWSVWQKDYKRTIHQLDLRTRMSVHVYKVAGTLTHECKASSEADRGIYDVLCRPELLEQISSKTASISHTGFSAIVQLPSKWI